MSLSSLLSKITPNKVLMIGVIGAAVSSLLLGKEPAIAIILLMAFVAELTYFKKLQADLAALFKFADVPAWPRFVALGVAALIAAHHGGLRGDIVLGFLLAAMDGNVFNALY